MSNTDFGYTQFQLPDGTTDLNAITFIARQVVERLDVMKLVKVMGVHPGVGSPPAAGTVDVLPLVSQVDGRGNPVKHGTVFGLPYFRLGGSVWQVVIDPVVGDTGYIICADRDSSLVVKNGGQQNPGSRRRYNIADGVYVGGVLNKTPMASIWLKADGTLNITDSKGNVLVSGASGWSLTGNVAVTGNLAVSGNVTDSGGTISLTTHIHSGVTTGGGNSGPPVP